MPRRPRFTTPALPDIPLSTLFLPSSSTPATCTLSSLAHQLSCHPLQLLPLVREGWIERAASTPSSPFASSSASITTSTLLHQPSDESISWMRNWFQPARLKHCFSLEDASALLHLTEYGVLELAKKCALPVVFEPALGGLVFSAWAVKRLLVEQAGANAAGRLDRQAMLHAILEDCPEKALAPPTFERRLEQEIERVAGLEEPARGLRAVELIAQWKDAKRVAQAAAASASTSSTCSCAPGSSSQFQPEQPASASKANLNAERMQACEQICSGLREYV